MKSALESPFVSSCILSVPLLIPTPPPKVILLCLLISCSRLTVKKAPNFHPLLDPHPLLYNIMIYGWGGSAPSFDSGHIHVTQLFVNIISYIGQSFSSNVLFGFQINESFAFILLLVSNFIDYIGECDLYDIIWFNVAFFVVLYVGYFCKFCKFLCSQKNAYSPSGIEMSLCKHMYPIA